MIITATVSVEVNEKDWANEYGLAPAEVRDDVKLYLQSALQECNPLITLKEVK